MCPHCVLTVLMASLFGMPIIGYLLRGVTTLKKRLEEFKSAK